MFFRTLQNISNSASFTGFISYSFNGKEKDDEWNGTAGAALDFGARIYDSRIGRFLSIDPLTVNYPNCSPYSAFNDNPMVFNDPSGSGGIVTIDYQKHEINVSAKLYVFPDESVTEQAVMQMFQINGNTNTSTIQSINTVELNYYNGVYPGNGDLSYNDDGTPKTKTYTVKYTIEVVVLTKDEAAAKLAQAYSENDPSVNVFKVQQAGVGPLGGQGHANIENPSGDEKGQGLNTGYLSMTQITNSVNASATPQQTFNEIIEEEVFHTMAGNYYDIGQLGANGVMDYSHNVTESRTSLMGIRGSNITFIDLKTIYKTLGLTHLLRAKTQDQITKTNIKSVEKSVGKTTNVMPE